ncbi:MAG TPA: polysaccharide deacetylase family protein [Thermoanaerobaculia bacterium]|nr:polysaccharide deacetylase family protein [Thermoanaerobaculia bacterium]
MTQRALDALLARSPAQPFFLSRAARRLTVLAYHAVDDPQRFAGQLDRLLGLGCRFLTLDEALEALAGRSCLPRRAVLVTFDDGDRSVLEHGFPLLTARGLPAVVFVVAGLVAGTRPPWWAEVASLLAAGGASDALAGIPRTRAVQRLKRLPDAERRRILEDLRASAPEPPDPSRQLTGADLRRLAAAGVAIGNHTLSHPCLPRCDASTVRHEITTAHERLAEILGAPPRAFAYPNGEPDPRAAAILAELGYEAAFIFDHRHAGVPCRDRFAVSRLRVNSSTPPDRFRIIVSGLHPAIHHALGRA